MKKIYFLFALIALLALAPACGHHHHHHHNDGPEVITLKPRVKNPIHGPQQPSKPTRRPGIVKPRPANQPPAHAKPVKR